MVKILITRRQNAQLPCDPRPQESGIAAAVIGGGQNVATFWINLRAGRAADGSLTQKPKLETRL